MNYINSIPKEGFIRLPEITKIFSISKSHWWLGVKNGKFPKGKKLSPQVTVWDVREIRKLIDKINNGGF